MTLGTVTADLQIGSAHVAAVQGSLRGEPTVSPPWDTRGTLRDDRHAPRGLQAAALRRHWPGVTEIRDRRSLRHLGQACNVSKSALAHYGAGSPIPLALDQVIDQAYGANGWIEAAITASSRAKWEPWHSGTPGKSAAHLWRGDFVSTIWIHLRPTTSEPPAY